LQADGNGPVRAGHSGLTRTEKQPSPNHGPGQAGDPGTCPTPGA
jgi:hypothetical protein